MIISTPLVLDHYMCNNDTQLFIDKFNSCPSISFSYFTDNEKHTKFYDDLKNILSLKYASEPVKKVKW